MITNFEEITCDLSEQELELLPAFIEGFRKHTKKNPIKSPKIVAAMKLWLSANGIIYKVSDVKVRQFANHIRRFSLLPLCATSDGYFVTFDENVIRSQIRSLQERARSIQACADGLKQFVINFHE
jgi:hypothetical protein